MSATIPESMRLDDLLKATGYDCPVDLQGKTFDQATEGGGSADLEDNKTVSITENGVVEITPSAGKDGMKKVTATVNVSGEGGDSLMSIPAFKEKSTTSIFQGIKRNGKLCASIAELKDAVWIVTLNSAPGASLEGCSIDGSNYGFDTFVADVYGSNYGFTPSVYSYGYDCVFSVEGDILTITISEDDIINIELEEIKLPLGIALCSNRQQNM